MAFADGELPPEEAAWVADRVAADADVARRLRSFTETRRYLGEITGAYAEIPTDLMDRVATTIAAHDADRQGRERVDHGSDTVVTMKSWRRSTPVWALPLAASVALAVGIGIGLSAAPDQLDAPFGTFTSADAQTALDTARTGETVQLAAGELRVLSTFRTGADSVCREGLLQPAAGASTLAVLCRGADGGWVPELAIRQNTDPNAFAPASAAPVLDAFLDEIAAGPPLDPDAEARALAE
jgi:hypothetical protein